MGKRPASSAAVAPDAKKSKSERRAYVFVRVTAKGAFPDGKVENTERALLRAGFLVDDTRDVGLSQDGDEYDFSHYYVAGEKLKKGGIGWQSRLRRTVHAVFEANHAAIADMAVVTRDGSVVEMASWSCLRNRNASLCTTLQVWGACRPQKARGRALVGGTPPNQASDATGARLVKIGGKPRVVKEQETTYNLDTDMDVFKDSYTARCYVPESFVF